MKPRTSFLLITGLIFWSQAWAQDFEPKSFQNRDGLNGIKLGLAGDCPRKVVYSKVYESTWTREYTSDCAYDESGHLIVDMRVYTNGVSTQDKYVYNEHGSVESYTRQVYDRGLGWVDVDRTTFIYDSNLLITRITVENYDPDTGQWELTDRTDTNYEIDNGQMRKKEVRRYDKQKKEMIPSKRYSYEYEDDQVKRETEETYTTNSYSNTFQYNHQYYIDKPGKVRETEQKRWSDDQWLNFTKQAHEYFDQDRSQTTTWSMWFNGVYELKTRLTNQNDEIGNDILYTVEAWQNLMWKLLSGYRNLITYQNNHAVEKVRQDYSQGGGFKSGTPGWFDAEKWEYSDFFNLGVDHPTAISFQAECYPNPAADRIEIVWSTPCPGELEMALLNLQGRFIRSDKLMSQAGRLSWDLSTLPAGVYLLRLTDSGGQVITRQIIRN